MPAVVYAADRGYFHLVDVLLEHGADLVASTVDGFDLAVPAAARGEMKLLKLLQTKGYDWRKTYPFLAQRPSREHVLFGCCLLHIASNKGQLEVMNFLLDNRFLDDLEALTDEHLTPLHLAVMGGSISVIDFLVERGVNLNLKDRNGKLPVDLAFEDGRIDVVRQLLSHDAGNDSSPTMIGRDEMELAEKDWRHRMRSIRKTQMRVF